MYAKIGLNIIQKMVCKSICNKLTDNIPPNCVSAIEQSDDLVWKLVWFETLLLYVLAQTYMYFELVWKIPFEWFCTPQQFGLQDPFCQTPLAFCMVWNTLTLGFGLARKAPTRRIFLVAAHKISNVISLDKKSGWLPANDSTAGTSTSRIVITVK